jgi:membrane protease YdiL (CAAX protease family)
VNPADLNKRFGKLYPALLIFVALVLFIPLFIFQGIGKFDFWWSFAAVLFFLIGLSVFFDTSNILELKKDWSEYFFKKLILGFLSAALLYLIFYAGNIFLSFFFQSAGKEITGIYKLKGAGSLTRISLFLFFIIGPGEELFWRGIVQRNLSINRGSKQGIFITTFLYTIIHIGSRNPVLVLASLLCGFFWGYLYLRKASILSNIISHTLWDMAVFILFPLAG